MRVTPDARRTARWPLATWQAGRVLAMFLALTLLVVGCGSDEEEDPGDNDAAGSAEGTPEPGEAEPEEEADEDAEESEEGAEEPPDEPVTITIGWHTPGRSSPT